jgi:hypothetical protein
MTPNDGEGEPTREPRKPYVAPKVIFSELYAKGVGVKNPIPTPDFHSGISTATS